MEQRNSGFSLIELLVVVAVLLPILTSITQMNMVVTQTIHTDDSAADVTENVRKTTQRIGSMLRPARLSSVEIRSNADDVTLLLAANTGEWISPTDLAARDGIRFEAAEGLLSINASLSTPMRQLTWDLEAGESANGVDDDGDGMIDEGDLLLLYGAERVRLASNLERCEFTLDGRLVKVDLTAAKTDSSGRTHRATISQSFYLRNN